MRLFAMIVASVLVGVASTPSLGVQRGHHRLCSNLTEWEQPVLYEVELRSKVEAQMMMAMDTRWEFDMRVKLTRESAADDGSGVVTLVHERIRVDLGGQQPTTGAFDSDAPRANADSTLGKVVTSIVGKPVTIEVDGAGKITAVRGLDALAPAEAAANTIFRQFFGESEFKRMYQPLFAVKQDPPTAELGEEWTISTEQSTGLELARVDHRLKLEQIRGNEAHVSIGGEIQMGESGGLIKTDESRIEGKAYWDTEGAQLDRFETESLLRASGDAPGMNLSIKLDSATKLKRVKGGGAGRPTR